MTLLRPEKRRRPPPGSGRPRRDPRAERAGASPGLAPEGAPPAAVPGVTATPHETPARARRDPRAVERSAAVVHGRIRIDRSRPLQLVDGPTVAFRPPAGTAAAGPRPVRIPAPACWVLAVPDHEDGRLSPHDRDMLGTARRLADSAGGAVVALVAAEDDALGAAGADRVIRIDPGAEPDPSRSDRGAVGWTPEARAAAVLAVIETLEPRHIVLPDVACAGGDVGRRVAAALGDVPAANVVALDGERVVSRGDGGRRDYVRTVPRVVLVAAEAAEPVTETVHEAAPLPAPAWRAASPRLVDCGLLPIDAARVPLAEAELILAGGAGVADWQAFHALAAALGAAEGGSRVACDAGALPRERQVGASGTRVSARVYIALGISGASQHLEGIKSCEYVIAVNTDPHAEILKRADLGIIGDAEPIVRELLAGLDAERRDEF